VKGHSLYGLACSHHFRGHFPHHLHDSAHYRIYVCQALPSQQSDATEHPRPHCGCFDCSYHMECGHLHHLLSHLPRPWANAQLLFVCSLVLRPSSVPSIMFWDRFSSHVDSSIMRPIVCGGWESGTIVGSVHTYFRNQHASLSSRSSSLSLWNSDFLIGHILLIMLTPARLVPYIDQLHSILLYEFFLQRYVPYSVEVTCPAMRWKVTNSTSWISSRTVAASGISDVDNAQHSRQLATVQIRATAADHTGIPGWWPIGGGHECCRMLSFCFRSYAFCLILA
jgi:hypothetical protein